MTKSCWREKRKKECLTSWDSANIGHHDAECSEMRLGILFLCCCNLLVCHANQREQWQAQAVAAAQAFEDYLACIKPALRSWEKAQCVRDHLLPACGVHEPGAAPQPLPLVSVQQGAHEGGGVGVEAQEGLEGGGPGVQQTWRV
ncbi:hypothetical protein DUNSADRAFT_7605, partial [Dunaliella salina]